MLLDRFVDSSLAYQGAGRELGVDEVRALNAVRDPRPAARPHAAADASPRRRGARACAGARLEPDRLEREDERFFARIADAYAELARAEPAAHPLASTPSQPPAARARRRAAALEDLLAPA